MQSLPLVGAPPARLVTRHASGEGAPWCLPCGNATRPSVSFTPCGKKGAGVQRKAGAVRSTLSAAKENFVITVREAESPSDLFACAWLRAHCFCKFPRLCAPDIQQRQRRLRAEEESAVLQQKIRGELPGFRKTACLFALVPVPPDALLDANELPLMVPEKGQSPELAPGAAPTPGLAHPRTEPGASIHDPGSGDSCSQMAVGTLDLSLGLRLPGEELVGEWPKACTSSGEELQWQRAYVSNVCVASAWRKRGVAGQLLQSAHEVAKSWGVLHLYIHVEYDNIVARRVYEREGYLLEKQETAAAARLFCRKPRLLLHKVLVGAKPPSRPFSCQA